MTTLLEEVMKDTSHVGRLVAADLLSDEGRELDALLFRIMGLEGLGMATWEIRPKKWVIQYNSYHRLRVILRCEIRRKIFYSIYRQGEWPEPLWSTPYVVGKWTGKTPPEKVLSLILSELHKRVLQLQGRKS